MGAPSSVVATFNTLPTSTITTTPPGLTIAVDGTNFTAPHSFNWNPGTAHTIAVTSPQPGASGVRYVLSAWSDSGAASHTITAPASVTTYTAAFVTQYYLTTAASSGGAISPGSGWYNAGATVPVSALPSNGYGFAGFSGSLGGMVATQNITLSSPASVSASFAYVGSAGVYYYSDPVTSIDTTVWTQNGSLKIANQRITSTALAGGSIVSKLPVPDALAGYEVRGTLGIINSFGTYSFYLQASPDALAGPAARGSAYVYEIANPGFNGSICQATLSAYKMLAGVATLLATAPVSCRSGMDVRAVYSGANSRMGLYVDGILVMSNWDSSIATGGPGFGVRGATDWDGITRASLGQGDSTPPNLVSAASISTSAVSRRVDLKWPEISDDPYGSGVAHYQLLRDGEWYANPLLTFYSDGTVNSSSTYSYSVGACDFYFNCSATSIPVTTPGAAVVDVRRTGVRPTGAYYGSLGENVDLLSGNLHFSIPLLKAQARSGWGVTFNLTYNSQNWRQDSGGAWKVGGDVGYGFGWRLLAGALTPIYGASGVLHHYVFTDGSGAEYGLNVQSGGVWTSTESVSVSYDANAGRLYFNDGSFWVMGCTSSGGEQDAGTMYPTLMQDSNGKQIAVRYYAGRGLTFPNTSARIHEIEDVRAAHYVSGVSITYTFTYTTLSGDAIPHLTSIGNSIGTAEGYSFTYSAAALQSPWSAGATYGAARFLQSSTVRDVGLSYQLATNGAGERRR